MSTRRRAACSSLAVRIWLFCSRSDAASAGGAAGCGVSARRCMVVDQRGNPRRAARVLKPKLAARGRPAVARRAANSSEPSGLSAPGFRPGVDRQSRYAGPPSHVSSMEGQYRRCYRTRGLMTAISPLYAP